MVINWNKINYNKFEYLFFAIKVIFEHKDSVFKQLVTFIPKPFSYLFCFRKYLYIMFFIINERKIEEMKKGLLIILLVGLITKLSAQEVQLPTPNKTGGKPLMEALSERKSYHGGFINNDLDKQTLADLLWAAYGFNRADKRTVPSASNAQEFSIYVLLSDGAYIYDAKENKLTLVAKGTFKEHLAADRQPYVNDVPVHLVYVANLSKSKAGRDGVLLDTGYISQNVYLFCASKGLGTVARASFSRKGLPLALKLTADQEITLVQAVGPVDPNYTE